jgi:hypothetical protein
VEQAPERVGKGKAAECERGRAGRAHVRCASCCLPSNRELVCLSGQAGKCFATMAPTNPDHPSMYVYGHDAGGLAHAR